MTTGALAGRVVDESGAGVPGATVEAVHEPTGTRYSAVSGTDGAYSILNVRAGSPYTVTATLSGFAPDKQSQIAVVLGGQTPVSFKLKVEGLTETVEVVGRVRQPHLPRLQRRRGPTSARMRSRHCPTVTRSIEDFARLSPYFNSQGSGDGSGANALSVAGRNTRYNNIQIDGAVNNDLFGLADSGTPGGQTEAQPISIDAVQELQLVVAPYDVRQGGFSGGGVNAITRSGTNEFHGTGYYFFRSEGPGRRRSERAADRDVRRQAVRCQPGRTHRQGQGVLLRERRLRPQGPALRLVDRRKLRPGVRPPGRGGALPQHHADAIRLRSRRNGRVHPRHAQRQVPRPRSTATSTRATGSSLRHNYVKGSNDIGFPTSVNYVFPDYFYQFRDTTNSSVAQLNSTFGSGSVNELRVTYQTRPRQPRRRRPNFPTVLVDVSGGGQFRSGRENFSTANALDQDVLELTDDFTMVRGNHSFTIGTHNEFFQFRNLFIRDNFGTYRFSSLDNLQAGLAQSYDYSFSLTGDRQQAAEFSVNQFGFYAGDLWRVNSRFTLNYGVAPRHPELPRQAHRQPGRGRELRLRDGRGALAEDVVAACGLQLGRRRATASHSCAAGSACSPAARPTCGCRTSSGTPASSSAASARASTPPTASRSCPIRRTSPRPSRAPTRGSFTNEIDVIDPDYKYPSLLRGNLGYDRELGIWGLQSAPCEFFYSRNLKDIDYQNLNIRQTGDDGPTGDRSSAG